MSSTHAARGSGRDGTPLRGVTPLPTAGWQTSDQEIPALDFGAVIEGQARASWLRRQAAGFLFLASDVTAFLASTALTDSLAVSSAVFLVTLVLFNSATGLYRSRLSLSVLDDLPHLLSRALMALGLTLLLVQVLHIPVPESGIPAVLLFLVLMVLGRAALYAFVRGLRRRGTIQHPTLVLGAGLVGRDLAAACLEHREYGLRPVGFIDGDPLLDDDELPVPVVGGPEDLADNIERLHVDHVIIAFTWLRGSEMVDVLRTCDRLQCEISLVPRLFEMTARGRETDEINGITLNRLHRAPFRSWSWPLKRVMDVTASGLALLLLSPIMIALAVLVRVVDGPGGVLFRQERVGIDGRHFQLLKFRSLRPATDEESETNWNIKHDDRLSWLGRLLRKTSLDELPQLWNILRGDMSLVGPRPERPYFVAEFGNTFPRYGWRHRVPSGLTGWAQIHGLRGDTSIAERARYDNDYIENWSLYLDVKILLRTVASMMKGSG